ncbi:sensor histidine kinase [Anaeromicropila herbilytica]|uniref:histidine kinase n=1 Tax=Anaeromicropila herbilytica TaxID=2785025 RepID=A0A7R7EQL7_9FIRM|nr:HAMP domain-containing sensor histidine kinase [Anaeromicropila herbilytica]BCN32971.1 hypothetical protein bsdtb5_42660 [Anaeromicropila herbilytica]
MKLKTIILITSLSLLLTFLFLIKYIDSLEYHASDIIKVNDIQKRIEEDMSKNSISYKSLEKKYSCRFILKSESEYRNELSHAIQKGNVVLDYEKGNQLIGKIIIPANSDSFVQLKQNLKIIIGGMILFVLIIIYIITSYLYVRMLRPFRKLRNFAMNISQGNLDIPLKMEKENYFGAFTESFDRMREELKKSRKAEFEANKSKKELVASLSHDIKTPVATIKALCEILEIKLKEEDALTKIGTINQKAEVIEKLINNLFHATLEELEALKIEPKEELSTIIKPMFMDINHYGKIYFKNEVPGCLIYCDRLRMNQVIDNIINNSYKYAGTDIDVSFEEIEDAIVIKVEDYGNRAVEEEIPLVFHKYYRGKNVDGSSGAGLGLYLAKQFIEGMGGSIECYVENGFVVILHVKKV